MAEDQSVVGPAEITVRAQIKRTDSGELEAPKNIIKNLTAARAVYNKFRNQHLKRITLYAAIEGLIAGNPPYDPGELAANGLGHIANFNTLEGRSTFERSALAYWNLLNEAEYIAKFTINDESPEARAAEDVISQEFDTVMREWPSFYTHMNVLSAQLVKFGVSPVMWPDERDWRWRTIELSKFYIGDQAQCDIDMITAVCVESYFTAQYLFEVYQEYKDKQSDPKCPWNTEALAEILFALANTWAKQTFNIVDFFDMQKRLQNGDLNYDTMFTDSIPMVSLFYKEYDGKFSHYMFHRTFGVVDFPYAVDRQYDSLTEGLIIFTASPGEHTIHSNRGVGHRMFSICQALMMNDCSTVDTSRWASTPILQGSSLATTDPQQLRFIPGVPFHVGSAQFVQNTMGANLEQQVYVSQYLRQNLFSNLANSGEDPGLPDRNQGSKSSEEIKGKSFREFSVLKNNVAWFYHILDGVFQTTVKKMLRARDPDPGFEYVKYWKERCIERGVPEFVFEMKKLTPWGMPRHLSVKASRVAGDGSTLARIMGLDLLTPILGDFGPREAREYKRQYISAALGKEQVTAFMQNADDADNEAGGASLAGVENAIMRQGESPVFSLDNDHRAHFATHMALCTDTINAIQQQQMDPVGADKIFTVAVPHIQQHFNAAARSVFAQKFVQGAKKSLEQIIQYATLNRKNAEKMIQAQIREQQQQAEKTQQVLSDEELKNIKAQGDEKRADYKVQSQVERAKEANETRGQVQRDKAQMDAENERLKIQLKHGNDTVATQAKVQNTLEQNRAKLAKMNADGGPAPGDLPTPM